MRVLVTGGRGFIGRRLVERLRSDYGSTNDIVHVVDIADGRGILDRRVLEDIRALQPWVVFHLAARHFVPWCREHPAETWETNVTGTAGLLQALGASVDTVVLASSAAVYGFAPTPRREADPLQPVDIYGASKVAAEFVLERFALQRQGTRCVAARLFNVVGAGDPHPHVVPAFAAQVRRHGRVEAAGNLHVGRDYVHVDDAVSALVTLAEGTRIGFHAYNVATGIRTSTRDLIEAFGSRPADVGRPSDLQRADDGDLVGDASKITAEIGWQPRRTLERAITDALEAVPA